MPIRQGKIHMNVIVTDHAAWRLEERKVTLLAICNGLRKVTERLQGLRGQEVMIIDKDNSISFIIAVHGGGKNFSIRIITLLNKSEVFVKNGTKVCKI
jgi:hypothetical protein